PLRQALAALAALGAMLTGAPAAIGDPARSSAAAPRPPGPSTEVEGAVLAIQGDDLVVDLGSARGATDGATVEIWRPIKLKHPVTGKVLTDRFRIGTLELTQVRTTMALARATAAPARPPAVGDVVVLSVAAAPAAPATPGPRPPEPSESAVPE